MSDCVFYFTDVRDAIAKALYGRLFGWIVNKVNQLLAPPMASRGEEVTEIGTVRLMAWVRVDCKMRSWLVCISRFSFVLLAVYCWTSRRVDDVSTLKWRAV